MPTTYMSFKNCCITNSSYDFQRNQQHFQKRWFVTDNFAVYGHATRVMVYSSRHVADASRYEHAWYEYSQAICQYNEILPWLSAVNQYPCRILGVASRCRWQLLFDPVNSHILPQDESSQTHLRLTQRRAVRRIHCADVYNVPLLQV